MATSGRIVAVAVIVVVVVSVIIWIHSGVVCNMVYCGIIHTFEIRQGVKVITHRVITENINSVEISSSVIDTTLVPVNAAGNLWRWWIRASWIVVFARIVVVK